jgi:hypothetical protein
MNEDNIKEETILDEEKTDDAQSNETNESAKIQMKIIQTHLKILLKN